MKSGVDKKNLDTSVRPQDDFFQFAVGGWLKRNPIPKTESRWGSFYVLRDKSWEALHKILKGIKNKKAKPGAELQKLRDFYRTAMDEKERSRQGIAPLRPYLGMIECIKSHDDLFRVLGKIHAIGPSPLWSPIVDQDEKKSEETTLHLWQANLVLPDREYYLKSDWKSKKIRREYIRYIVRLLGLAGRSPLEAQKAARIILDIETRLAHASRSRAALRDPEKQYHKMTPRAVAALTPKILWNCYFSAMGMPPLKTVIVGQPEFFRAVSAMVSTTPLESLKIYLAWYLLDALAGFLSEKFARERFRFHGTVISGTTQLRPLWQRAVMTIDVAMGEALGKFYIKKYFGGRAKKSIAALVDHVMRSFARRIQKRDWMSAETKKRSLEKLTKIRRKIAFPKRWRDYRLLEIKKDSYLENFFRAQHFETRRLLAKIGKPLDRSEWFISPPTVNAYYQASLNEITFPAGILQPPFFDPDAYEAVNYGAIGSVIGHELTHGFDDQGSKFDGKGNMREWWAKGDRKKFIKRASVLVKQFDQFVAVDDIHVNGKLTLGENIADLGGLVIAYHAFKGATKRKRLPKTIDGFTPEQLFFLGFAQAEVGHTRPEEQRRLATIDPHAPAKYRVNGPLPHMKEFCEAFRVKAGDKMFRRSKNRATIW
ncbi:MAG: M13 family metallopeptidase [Candidatus Sungbacteria bacterium]|uniref:M13 family metallopeptidase n=1 Tax=Candidatus Sungiibacteriota bacterium TaxID=2750080 RepID=A0A933DTL8_9BACT|nr:M13 family metallopeptidase [Candidatus Sungbacteria bacterium]